MKVRKLLSIAVMCLTASVGAAPFARWLEVDAADGRKVRVWGEGDEFAAHFETEDGYAVVFDQTRKVFVYVDRDAAGALVSTGIALGEEASNRQRLGRLERHLRDTSEKHRKAVRERVAREQVDSGLLERWRALKARHAAKRGAARTTDRSVVGVTILVDFPISAYNTSSYWEQQHPSVKASDVADMMNGENFTKWGNASSVRSYYRDASCGHLDYSNVVLGPFKAPYPRSHYEQSSVDAGDCGRALIADIFTQMKNSSRWQAEYLPELRKASYEGKSILALNVLYAGPHPPAQDWGYGLWPHKSTLSANVYSILPIDIDNDTKHLYTYEISPVTSSPEIGTICHENGHMVCGFPDFYSYYHGYGCGAGYFSLMGGAADGNNPEYFDPYLRAMADWIVPKNLPSSGTVTVKAELGDVWKYTNPSDPGEYYLIENRRRVGRDAAIPAAGVLIWRCDESGQNRYADPLPAFASQKDGTQYRLENELSLEQADGLYEIERRTSDYGNANDAWFSGNTSSKYVYYGGTFSDDTLPTARWKDASPSGLELSRFSAAGETMTFAVSGGESGEKPNLLPYQPSEWGGKIVFTTDPSDLSSRQTSFASGRGLYLNWAVLNDGPDIGEDFSIVLDYRKVGEDSWKRIDSWEITSLSGGFYVHLTDLLALDEYVDLERGAYEFRLVADAEGDVDEQREDDNECTVTITVEGDLGTALDNEELEFETDGDADWFAETEVTFDGEDAVRSGRIGDSGRSVLRSSVCGPGVISFFWNVSSEERYDWLTFKVDGEEKGKISGSPGWAKCEVEIMGGEDEWHELEWIYSKDTSRSVGEDCGWVDQVVWLEKGTETVSVTFYPYGGTLPSGDNPRTYYVGSRYGDMPVPTWSGHSFLGWWTSAAGGRQVTSADTVSASWTSLHAHWQEAGGGGGGGGGGGSVADGKYALCVGLNEYSPSYIPSYNWLDQCEVDAESVYSMLVNHGGWGDGACKWVNEQGTRSAILAKLAEFADAAKPGDQVVYYHSSHGGSNGPQDYGSGDDKDAYICTYDGDLTDTDFANALLGFKQGVRLLIVIDACRSGGMFQAPRAAGTRMAQPEWNFAASVMEKFGRARQAAAVRGDAVPRLSGSEIAWITAADYNEYSYELRIGPGGAFTRAWTQGIISGAADSPDLAGDGDGNVSAYEAAQYAREVIVSWSKVQCPYESASQSFVLAEIEPATLDEALGADYQWETDAEDGDYEDNEWYSVAQLEHVGWFGECVESLDGCAARSGAIIDYEKTTLRTRVTGAGEVSFKWRVSSEAGYDWLTFSVDGEVINRISGVEGGWVVLTHMIDCDGQHELSWTYAKDSTGSAGEDCGWIDQFRWSGEGPVVPGEPPENDDFENAAELDGGSGTATGDSTYATQQDDDPEDGRTVWWRWTAPRDGMVTFSTLGSDFDTQLGAYTGGFEELQEIAWNDDSDGSDDYTSRMSFRAEKGVEYAILVTGYDNAGGEICLTWTMADDLEFGPGRVSRFAMPRGRTAVLVGVSGAIWDLFSNVDYYDASCLVDDRVVDAEKDGARNNDDFWCGALTDMDMMFMQGWTPAGCKTVDDVVDNFDRNARNDIRWADSPSTFDPTSDDDWDTLHEGKYGYKREDYYTGMFRWLADRTPGSDILSHVTAGTVDGQFLSTLKSSMPEKLLHLNVVFEDGNGHEFWGGCRVSHSVLCCGYAYAESESGESALKGLFVIDADNDQYVDGGGSLAPNSIAYCPVEWTGSGYSIDGIWGETGMIEAQFVALSRKTGGEFPDNDNFADAAVISGDQGKVHGTSAGATVESGEPRHFGRNSDATVWWRWTAPANGKMTLDTLGSSFDTVMAVYTGNGILHLDQLVSNDDVDEESEEYWSRVEFDAAAGETYHIAVAGSEFGDDDGEGAIQLNWTFAGEKPVKRFYTIVFAPGDGAKGTMGKLTFQLGKFETLPANEFKRDGYHFDGWLCEETGNKYGDAFEVLDLVGPDETATLVAQWRKKKKPDSYVVVFVSGEGVRENSFEVSVGVGMTFWLSKCPFSGQTDQEFAGWLNRETEDTYADRERVRDLAGKGDTVTLVAQWRKRKVEDGAYTVVFSPGEGGMGSMDPLQVPTNAAVRLPKCTFRPKIEDVAFARWMSDAGKVYRDEQEIRDIAKAGETVTLTAQWGAGPFPAIQDGLSDDEKKDFVLGYSACTYDGYLIATNDDNSVVGAVTVKVDKKGKVKATVTRLGAKKLSYKSLTPLADGEVDLVCTKDPAQMHLTVYAGGIEGTCGEHKVTCRKNVAKENAMAYQSIQGKVWTVALKASELEASETTGGYASLTVTAAKKGKVKVTGLLPDGTKVSASAQAQILPDKAFVIPIVAQLYSRKSGGISLFLQVDAKGDEPRLTGVGDWVTPAGSLAWDAAQSCCTNVSVAGIVRKTDQFVLENPPETIQGMNVATQFLHSVSNMTFMGKKWQIAKGGKIKLMGNDFVDQAASPNPGGLTLSYAPKTGAFKGKYAVYVNNFGKSKKLSATINGVVVGESGYGTAVIKKKCSIPVRVEEQKK